MVQEESGLVNVSIRTLIRIGFLVCLLAGILASAGGCAHLPHASSPPPIPPVHAIKHPVQSMANALGEIDSLMSVVTILSVALFGVGVILMFYLRTALGPAMMAGGIASLVLSVFVKSMLWFVPWIAGGVALIGVIAFVVDVRKRGLHATIHDIQNLVHPAQPVA